MDASKCEICGRFKDDAHLIHEIGTNKRHVCDGCALWALEALDQLRRGRCLIPVSGTSLKLNISHTVS